MVNASGFRCPYEPDVLELREHDAPYAAAAEYSALGDDRIRPCSSRSGDGDTDRARFLPPGREKLCPSGLHSPEPVTKIRMHTYSLNDQTGRLPPDQRCKFVWRKKNTRFFKVKPSTGP